MKICVILLLLRQVIIIQEYLWKFLSSTFKWNIAVFFISLFFSFILVGIYCIFYRSKTIAKYKEDYNKAIENLALKFDNDTKHQENLYLSRINNLNEKINELNNQVFHLKIALNRSEIEAMVEKQLGGKNETR